MPELNGLNVSYTVLKRKVKKETLATLLKQCQAQCAQCNRFHQGKDCLFLRCGCVVRRQCLKEELCKVKPTLEGDKSQIVSLFECPKHKQRLATSVVRGLFSPAECEKVSCDYTASMNKGKDRP